jgi:hypothetical protein
MNTFTLNDDVFINVTPRGVYYAIQSNHENITRSLLLKLLQYDETPPLSTETLSEISSENAEDTMDLLHNMQKTKLISGHTKLEAIQQGTLEDLLPELLKNLSESGKVLLAEKSGLYLGASGFPHEAAEELAAISASLSEVYQRHKGLLQGNLGFSQHAWGLIDAAGNSEVGFWPIYVNDNQFTLVIDGLPQLNNPSFKQLIWVLVKRYGQ